MPRKHPRSSTSTSSKKKKASEEIVISSHLTHIHHHLGFQVPQLDLIEKSQRLTPVVLDDSDFMGHESQEIEFHLGSGRCSIKKHGIKGALRQDPEKMNEHERVYEEDNFIFEDSPERARSPEEDDEDVDPDEDILNTGFRDDEDEVMTAQLPIRCTSFESSNSEVFVVANDVSESSQKIIKKRTKKVANSTIVRRSARLSAKYHSLPLNDTNQSTSSEFNGSI